MLACVALSMLAFCTFSKQQLICWSPDQRTMLRDAWLQLLSKTFIVLLQVALKFTEAQEQDLLHLGRLFYSKLG